MFGVLRFAQDDWGSLRKTACYCVAMGKGEALELEFDRLTAQGMAAAAMEGGRTAVAWGVLPGERARVWPQRKRKGMLLCRLDEILRPSADRVAPREAHYLSCSPWQAMSEAAQTRAKRQILEELFPGVPLTDFVAAGTTWGYRNKLEFNFTDDAGKLHLAFHERGSPYRKLPIPDGCRLASAAMNRAALEVVARLAERGVDEKALKSLVVRGSRATGEAILGLYVMDENFDASDLELDSSAGLTVFYSDPLSPASVATRLLFRRGADHLTERVAGLDLAFPLDGFFQNHAETFSRAVAEMRRHVAETGRIVELYSGVGSIGLALGDRAREILAVESNPAAVEWAERNRERIGVAHYHPRATRVEDCTAEIVAPDDVVVADPPRSGLHSKVVSALVDRRPRRILYLSCHPENQARDIGLLRPAFRPFALLGFDFYPQTPHIESLVVLDRVEAGAS